MNSQDRLGEEHEFDRLLRRAEWPESPPEQIARLGDHWRAIARRRRARLRYGAVAMAASIVLFATVLALRQSGVPRQAITATQSEPAGIDRASARTEIAHVEPSPVDQPPVDQPQQPADLRPAVPVATAATPQPTALPSPSAARSIEPRDPTPYERIVFLSTVASRRHHRGVPTQSAGVEQKRTKLKQDSEPLNELIAALAADPAADVDARLAAVESDFWRTEPSAWEVIERGSPERRLAAAQVIARIGTARSLPVLAGLLGDPATHKTAIAGLCRLARPADLKGLAIAEPNAALRQQLLTALLARRTEESVGLYLELVNDGFRADALTASSAMADPPVDLLIAFLENPQRPVRLAAAQTLGSLPEADIAARLSDSVFRGIGRQEALLALLLSPDAQSARFLAAARQNFYLMASVYAAEQQLHSLTLTER